MNHKELFELFLKDFGFYPNFTSNIDCWFPNGKDSIRIRYTDKGDLVFTYLEESTWKKETIKEFVKSKKGSVSGSIYRLREDDKNED